MKKAGKPKKVSLKLTKETLRKLRTDELKLVAGGGKPVSPTCITG